MCLQTMEPHASRAVGGETGQGVLRYRSDVVLEGGALATDGQVGTSLSPTSVCGLVLWMGCSSLTDDARRAHCSPHARAFSTSTATPRGLSRRCVCRLRWTPRDVAESKQRGPTRRAELAALNTMPPEQAEETLRETLGVQTILWLPEGLVGDDDTDGHVDNMAAWVTPGVVVLAWPHHHADDTLQREVSEAALAVLRAARDAHGRRLTVHKLRCPPPLHRTREEAAGLTVRRGKSLRPICDPWVAAACSRLNEGVGQGAALRGWVKP